MRATRKGPSSRKKEIKKLRRASAESLRAKGKTVLALRDADYSSRELVKAGYPLKDVLYFFPPEELKRNGFSASQLLPYHKIGALRRAGFSPIKIQEALRNRKKVK